MIIAVVLLVLKEDLLSGERSLMRPVDEQFSSPGSARGGRSKRSDGEVKAGGRAGARGADDGNPQRAINVVHLSFNRAYHG